MSTFCKGSGRTVAFALSDVTEVSTRTGRPSVALVTCRRCHRTALRARVCMVQIALGTDDGIAIMPHHYVRKEPCAAGEI